MTPSQLQTLRRLTSQHARSESGAAEVYTIEEYCGSILLHEVTYANSGTRLCSLMWNIGPRGKATII